jgi:HAMP domain-containing protein
MARAPRPSLASRTLTVLAAGFLAFDGASLIAAGIWLSKPLMVIIGVCLFASSGLVFLYWRRHQRRVQEIDEARRAVVAEARALRDLARGN